MYLDCFKCHGKPYLRIVENYNTVENGIKKQKRKTIKNLGYLDKFDDGQPDFIKRMKDKLKNGELLIDGIEPNEFRARAKLFNNAYFNDSFNNYRYLNPKNIGYLFLENIYNELGLSDIFRRIKSDSKIEYDLNGIVKMLVFGRILDPASKLKTFENRDSYLFPITNCNDENPIYRSLDVLDENSKKIQNRINIKIKNSTIGRITNLTYYDVTNYFFETMYGDEDIYELDESNEIIKDEKGKPVIVKKGFRKNGVSKENRKEPIVQMGLFIDSNGIPVSHKLFPGNTQDKITFKNVLENDVDEMDLGRIVVVADNGMNTQENKYLITEKGNGYIVSKSVKKSWTKMEKWALDNSDYKEIKDASEEVVFKHKSRINEIELTYKNQDGKLLKKTIKEKEIIYWSKKHYEKEKKQNKKFIEYLESCKEHPDKLKDKQRKSQEFIKTVDVDPKTGEILHPEKVIVFLDKKLEKYKETMGFYSIVTSEIEENDEEIINRYHGLSRIEDSFRIIKSDLEGRPIYVWLEEHIKSHFLICFISLTIIRLLQYKILKNDNKSTLNVDGWEQGITAEKIKEELNKFEADQYDDNSYKLRKPTEEIKKLLKIYDLENFNFLLPTKKEIIELKNTILKKEL